LRSFGEYRRAAGGLDELLDPPDTRNQRVVPFFEKHLRLRLKRAADFRIASSPLSRLSASRSASLLQADQSAKHSNHRQDLRDAALIERHDREAPPNELGRDVGLKV
jgi:hypothetical protein